MSNYLEATNSVEFWKRKVIEAENFDGPQTEFCKIQNLKYSTFKNWKHRLSKGPQVSGRRATKPSRKKSIDVRVINPSAFSSVQVIADRVPVRVDQLPDPKWLSELIFHLHGRFDGGV